MGICSFLRYAKGLERAAQPKAGQKLRTVEQFLARGRVHGAMAAAGVAVDIAPFGL